MAMGLRKVKRFDVYRVTLDPTRGSEIQKTRPCLVISPDEMNNTIRTAIVAPMTSKGRDYPTRVACSFQGREGQIVLDQIVLDQIRTVDKSRLLERMGRIDEQAQTEVLRCLGELFAP